MAVPPCGVRPDTACFAYCLVVASATARLPSCGYTGCASWVPATTANATPSRITSTAAAVAARASAILVCGDLMDPEQSMMMISALPESAAGPGGPPSPDVVAGDVTVTMALTSSPPSGRYSFWEISTVKSGWLIGGLLLGIGPDGRRPGLVAVSRVISGTSGIGGVRATGDTSGVNGVGGRNGIGSGSVTGAGGLERERGENHRHVVHAAGLEGEIDQRPRRAERIVKRPRQRLPGQLRGLGLVVPQPVRAQQQRTRA